MSDLTIEVPTAKTSMAEIRPALDAALAKEFPGGLLGRKWDGEILQLSGPGAQGSIAFEEGKLVGRARRLDARAFAAVHVVGHAEDEAGDLVSGGLGEQGRGVGAELGAGDGQER